MDQHSSAPDRRVFLSYALEDAPVARVVQRRLHDAGVEVWSADSIPAGERWGAAIQRELASADDVVVLLSKAAQTSLGVSVEVGAAVAATESHEGRRMIPVVVEDLAPTGLLASYQWIKGYGKSPAEIADEVIAALDFPSSMVSKEAARAEELRELRELEAALSALREEETLVATRRARLVSVFLVIVLLLATAAAAIALIGGAEIAGAALASTLSATVGVLGTFLGFLVGRQSSGRSHE